MWTDDLEMKMNGIFYLQNLTVALCSITVDHGVTLS